MSDINYVNGIKSDFTVDVKLIVVRFLSFQFLSGIESEESRAALCEEVLPMMTNSPRAQHFLINYLINFLPDSVVRERWSYARFNEVLLLKLGCQAVLKLPREAQDEYRGLVAKPIIIFEMMLMNRKVLMYLLLVAYYYY